ncbi:MAG: hypothetical protein PHI48_05830 [Bacteroidales bacterium]|nr:hypothetical protein [Bacteroidales bacterium]
MNLKGNGWSVVLVSFFLMSHFPVAMAQEEENNEPLTAATFDLVAATNDVIYLDSVAHMMDQSPLSCFSEYKKILFDGTVIDTDKLIQRATCARIGLKDKEYSAQWVIVDSLLYLSDVSFLYAIGKKMVIPMMVKDKMVFQEIDGVIGDKYYKMLETLTESRFMQKKLLVYSNVPVSRFGLMPAGWFNGVLNIKRVIDPLKETLEEWEKVPYRQLTFKTGRLIAVEDKR